jgi:hypothetical protein
MCRGVSRCAPVPPGVPRGAAGCPGASLDTLGHPLGHCRGSPRGCPGPPLPPKVSAGCHHHSVPLPPQRAGGNYRSKGVVCAQTWHATSVVCSPQLGRHHVVPLPFIALLVISHADLDLKYAETSDPFRDHSYHFACHHCGTHVSLTTLM